MLNFFKKNKKREYNIDEIINYKDTNEAIIEIDDHICELCSNGEELDKLNSSQIKFFYNQELERGVNMDGFEQYLSNTSGRYANEAIEALEAINAKNTVKILQKALEVFPNSKPPKDDDKRADLIEKLPQSTKNKWDALDEKFLDYKDDLNELNLKFVKENISDFR